MLTLTNLFLGCVGIIYVFYDQTTIASYLIFTAAIIDFLDGFVARALKAESQLGEQLDSLADCVTFGVLPGFIFYNLLGRAYAAENGAFNVGIVYLMPAFLISIFSALRLAKFNIDELQKTHFIGLPTPATAIFTATLPLIYFSNQYGLTPLLANKWVLYLMVLVFSYLLISPLPMFSLKFKTYDWKSNNTRYVFLAASVLLIIFMHNAGIAAVILLYIIMSIVQNFSKHAIQS